MAGRVTSDTTGEATHLRFDDGGMNLLSSDALQDLRTAIDGLSPATRLLTFRSSREGIFAAGADMAEMRKFDSEEARRFSEAGQGLFETIERLPMVTVALADGDCFGGALDLAMAFDLRFSTMRSRFAHPGSKIGIVTGFRGTGRWRSILPPKRVAGLMLENRTLSATEAEDAGLVDRLFDSFDEELDRELDRLAALDRNRVRFVKELVTHGMAVPAGELPLLARSLAKLYLGEG